MKTNKTKYSLVLFLLFSANMIFAQGDWNTGGNALTNTGILGSSSNWDVRFRTDGINRLKLMQTSTHTVDNYFFDNSGFLMLSTNPTELNLYEPYSLLHLNGDGNTSGTGPQPWGYRDWMYGGITMTQNRDLMYIGPKAGTTDRTDAVIAWADNAGAGGSGPDVLRFLFTNFANGAMNVSGNHFDDSDNDGVEIARMTGTGQMGVGVSWDNTFMPQRTLDVIYRNNDAPQFRLTRNRSTTVTGGDHADFQVDDNARLFIRPEENGSRRPTAIGFLRSDVTGGSPIVSGGLPLQSTALDVGGQTRIRNLPASGPDALIIGYSFADVNETDPADHFLGRLDFPDEDSLECWALSGAGTWVNICDGLGGIDCRWTDINSTLVPGQLDMFTGSNPATEDCYRGKVGIGTTILSEAKFNVWNAITRDRARRAIFGFNIIDSVIPTSNSFNNRYWGVHGFVRSTIPFTGVTTFGVHGESYAGKYVVGVYGQAYQEFGTTHTFGVRGEAQHSVSDPTVANIAVYAEIQPDPGSSAIGANDLALMIVGPSATVGSGIQISDESVKTGIEAIENASELLSQLNPVTYNYVSPVGRPVPFEEDLQYGLIAQQVQDVIPSIVESVQLPAYSDTTNGFYDGTELDLLGVQYESLIPVLIAGFQEQNGIMEGQAEIIETQNETIAAMEVALAEQQSQLAELQSNMAQLASQFQSVQQKSNQCCDKVNAPATGFQDNSYGPEMKLEQNVPNPFDQYTRISFDIPRDAQVILEISDASGRPIETLFDGQMSAGNHSFEWDGSRVAPGIYFYTLYANGELLTKKMIKR
jgi:uncharacterized coiled-coil protein SlyX